MPLKKTFVGTSSSFPVSPKPEPPSSSTSAPVSPFPTFGIAIRFKRESSPFAASSSNFTSAASSQSRSPPPGLPLDLPELQALAPAQAATERKGKRNQRDVVLDFNDYFGEESQLENWQKFCRHLGLGPEGKLRSIKQCRKALIPVWVNIHDFLDARAAGGFPQKFKSEKALAEYTRNTRRFYPRAKAKAMGPVRALLAHIVG